MANSVIGKGLFGWGLWATALALGMGCADAVDMAGWQAGGGPARTNAYAQAVSTTLNTAKRLDLLADSADFLATPVMLANNVAIAALADGRLVRIENGAIAWSFAQPDRTPFAASFAVDAEGTVTAVDARGRMVALDAQGRTRWTHTLLETASRVTVSDVLRTATYVVAAEAGGTIAVLDAVTGTVIWKRTLTSLRTTQLASDARGGILAVLAGAPDTLVRIDPKRGVVARTALDGVDVTAGPVVTTGGLVVVAGRTTATSDGAFGAVCAVRDGTMQWNTRIGTIPQFVSALGDTTYVVASEPGALAARASRVIAMDDRGARLWGVWYDKVITSPLIIGHDAMLCTVTEDVSAHWHDVMVLWRDGRIRRHIPLSKVPRVLPEPVVTPNRTVQMAAADGCTVVVCDETLMYNILPQ